MQIEFIHNSNGDTGNEVKNELYSIAVLYEYELDEQTLNDIINNVNKKCDCKLKTNLINKYYLLQLTKDDVDKIKVIIQEILDMGYCLYINDGSDVIFRPGMIFNIINHQRMQLINYRFFLRKNDARMLKRNIRQLFLNKNYWKVEDGKDFSQMMQDAFTQGMDKGKKTIIVNQNMINKWINLRWEEAEYESLHISWKDYKRDFSKVNNDKDKREIRKIIQQTEKQLHELKEKNKKILKRIKKQDKEEENKLMQSFIK